ncbi:aspartate--tRNA(Asn) ligase [Candidatus Woesearchaeota archaeon]|jgi:aspartyl-tRNA synthetase|nr:aspartate--tRNA(Asn) ligase [Candidatus Woesearchaeota archaeon]MBT6734828.1 aspartate--tRNA(Asn) ligase [Candidatus Woesearchaeota archaeon]MBT7169841.1 aspartate--tRNA(Asn) ligase [Candidatus Woesearchaeota archaeon]MBT7474615.1 aspartate--tRNA(Asn) ligase [Candidatus Woesearchaeota archaeon]
MLANRILIRDALVKNPSSEAVVSGWIKQIKPLGKLIFITLRDRSGEMQLIAKKELDNFKVLSKVTRESSLVFKGNIQESKQKSGGNELEIKDFEILNQAETPLPIDVGAGTSNIDKRLDHRFLDTREEKINAIFKIRSKIYKLTTDFFDDNDFTNITTPKITSAGVESGAELFEMKYFNKKAYLSQSPQIYKQMFVAGGFERVYELAPVFRAENSNTTRHLTEFTGIDMEMGFIQSESDVMDVIEELFKFILNKLKKECKRELELLGVNPIVPKKIPRLSMKEVKEMLSEKGKSLLESDDLDSEAESIIGKIIKEKYNEEFVFVTNYPWEIRPFYHMKPEDDKNGTKSFDLIWNGVEIATGAQREHRYNILKEQAKEKGINLDEMESYAEIFKFGCPPHGGIGLGLDRMVQRLLNLDNVREAILLPRDPERLTP